MPEAATEGTIPSTMDALALLGPNEFEIQTAAVPPVGPQEVLCEVHSVAICGTDKEIISVSHSQPDNTALTRLSVVSPKRGLPAIPSTFIAAS